MSQRLELESRYESDEDAIRDAVETLLRQPAAPLFATGTLR